jgi:hypothetical protein
MATVAVEAGKLKTTVGRSVTVKVNVLEAALHSPETAVDLAVSVTVPAAAVLILLGTEKLPEGVLTALEGLDESVYEIAEPFLQFTLEEPSVKNALITLSVFPFL